MGLHCSLTFKHECHTHRQKKIETNPDKSRVWKKWSERGKMNGWIHKSDVDAILVALSLFKLENNLSVSS